MFFEESKKSKDDPHEDLLKDADIVELASAHFNLFGPSGLVDFILAWRPPEVVFRVARLFIRRLVDTGNFAAIDEISRLGNLNQHLTIAIADELLAVGKFPSKDVLCPCLDLFTQESTRIPKSDSHFGEDAISKAIISFCEACAATGLSNAKILLVLEHYFPEKASRSVSSEYQGAERAVFLRGVALKCVLSRNLEPSIESLMPLELVEKEKGYYREQDEREFRQIIGGLLPWYRVRSLILAGTKEALDGLQDAAERSRKALAQRWRDHDPIGFELSRVRFETILLNQRSSRSDIESFAKNLSDNDYPFALRDRLIAVRAAYRLEHLSGIRDRLEKSCHEIVSSVSDEGPEVKAEWYIDLARAVLPISRADATVYFDYAIEAVSRFGDEVVERWGAIVALAKRSAEADHSLPDMAYRFIRCAELIGDNVAREKHWDRDEAIEVCSRLCPTSAFAALSRWRDRDVGWFDRQLSALAYECLRRKIISAAASWSLSAFKGINQLEKFAALCIDGEPSAQCRQYMLDTAVQDLRLGGAAEKSWRKLEVVAQNFSLENLELKHVLSFFQAEQSKASSQVNRTQDFAAEHTEKLEDIDWGKILDDLDLITSEGLSHAIDRFDAMSAPRHPGVFWNEVFQRVPEGDASKFLSAIGCAERADLFDVESALSRFPDSWRQKVSVMRLWPNTLSLIARRFASEFTNYFRREYFLKNIRADDAVLPLIRTGVMQGLSGSCNLVGASTFFGFSEVASTSISRQEAVDLLDFALARLEGHIAADYADGPWGNWLRPPEKVRNAFAGFIWAALGSPCSSVRWQAAHCVRRLAENGCEHEIDALIEWMNGDSVGAFGNNKFPFYNLHARQYLLIALARVAIDKPEVLRRHHAVFVRHALDNISHVLIQKFAAEIALSIETSHPGIYDSSVSERLRQIGTSQMPLREIHEWGETFESPWHSRGEVDRNLRLYFGYDFDSYWFQPLGGVFGISTEQVEDLAREVVLKDWNIEIDEDLIRDPRARLWRSHRHENETYHSHGSYPRTDNYSFYLSYHAMLSVAAKLVQRMPVTHRRDWCENEWSDWLHRHTLTRSDGRWLADRRDPAPLERRRWLQEKKTETWRWEIVPDDFLDGLLIERNSETWLNVFGYWSDNDGEHEESFHVASALVAPEASQSLLNALATCQNPHNFKLPDYQEDRMELAVPPFELKGWIWHSSKDNRLDQFDRKAAEIDYPAYRIGKSIIEQLQLSVDSEERLWTEPNSERAALVCELWSDERAEERDNPIRRGNRMSASLEFLTKLCSVLGCQLIVNVEIERRLRSRYARNENGIEYLLPNWKIYILTADGTLRDERTHYHLRQGTY